MIQFSKNALFALFSASLFFLGLAISTLVDEGLKEGKELFYQLGTVVPLITSAIVFGMKLYSKPKDKQIS